MREYTWKSKKYMTLSILIILLLWQGLSIVVNNEILIPPLKAVTKSFFLLIKDKNFVYIVMATLVRSILSFLLSFSMALVLGILASRCKFLYNFMLPLLAFLKSVPTMAIVILALIWLNSEKAPILIGFIVVFPILYESVLSGIFSIDPKIVDMAKLYKVKTIHTIKDIVIPSILSSVNSVITSAIGLNLKVVIAGEVLGQPKYAIGSSLQMEKLYLNTSGVFAWILVVVGITILVEFFIGILYKKIYKWK